MKRLLTTVLLALPLLLLSCTKGGEGMVITPPSNTKPSSRSDSETQTPTTPQTPQTPEKQQAKQTPDVGSCVYQNPCNVKRRLNPKP